MQFSIHVDVPLAEMLSSGASQSVIEAHMTKAMTFMREKLVGDIRSQMHFKNPTGNLESSIHAEPSEADPWQNSVGPGDYVHYSRFVNYGTGRRGAASGIDPPEGYVYGPRPGMRAQPYMEPAFELAKAAVDSAFNFELQAALAEIGGQG